MKETLSYVIVTPYSVGKSRTGGIIARLLSRTQLELVGAQMVTPDENFVRDYAASLRDHEKRNLSSAGELLADYVERNMMPIGERRRRLLLLIFRGEDACKQLSESCGALFPGNHDSEFICGETIRDTYADYIVDPDNPEKILHFEPAILTPRLQESANENMAIFARHLKNSENIIRNMTYKNPQKVEQTLVILKPENWNHGSSRPGNIIDMFSRTGLRVVGTKILCFSLNQALEFYGPVEAALKEKLSPVFGHKAREVLEKEFSLTLSDGIEKSLAESFGQERAREEFYKIVEFMSGRRPDTCPPEDADKAGDVKCMLLIYEGEDAIRKIRDILGPTDPLKAPAGTIRREFGSTIMINTAHASDSSESYEREKKIVMADDNPVISIIEDFLAARN